MLRVVELATLKVLTTASVSSEANSTFLSAGYSFLNTVPCSQVRWLKVKIRILNEAIQKKLLPILRVRPVFVNEIVLESDVEPDRKTAVSTF
jgi:hypothetical protein